MEYFLEIHHGQKYARIAHIERPNGL